MKQQNLKLSFLGGVSEVGKNMMCLEYNNDIIVIDSGCAFPSDEMMGVDLVIPDITYLINNRQKIRAIILTHGHFDHVAYLPYFSSKYPDAKVFIHPNDGFYIESNGWHYHTEDFYNLGLTSWVENVENLGFPFPAGYEALTDGKDVFGWKVIHTPGHTPGSVCLYNETEKVLISGDTLFDDGIGRTDLRGGSMSEMEQSLKKLDQLPQGIRVYPGHDRSFVK